MNQVTSEILFEKFEIIECFKKDEHASVYLANHIYLGKKIILKVLNTKTIFDEAKIERFKREAKIMAKLEDPNIIKVLDFGTFNEFFYISFEYFESKNLRAFIKDKSLSLEQKKNLVVQLFKGLNYAHQNQIIHRDIKPENILVNEKSELKIGDFGLALALNDNFVTSQYSIVGTPCYMSPEQVQGGKLTSQSDLFSAGILALELFTEKNPFLGDDINQTISNLINYNAEIIEAYLVNLPEELQQILRKLLSKKTERRYKSAKEVLKDLEIPLSEIRRTPLYFLKNRKILYSVVSLGMVFIIALIFSFVGQNDQIDDDPSLSDNISGENSVKSDRSIDEQDGNEGSELLIDNLNPKVETDPSEIPETRLEDSEPEIINDSNTERIASVAFGSLYVECIPWAHIYLEDRRLDTTPISEPIDLRAGIYNIKLVHPEYPEYLQTIEIKPDETSRITVNLDTLYGYLACNVFPWGDVYLNDKFLGQTPFGNVVKLIPGSHVLTVKHPEYPDVVEKINIIKSDTLVVHVNLTETLNNKFGVNN